MLGSSCSPCCSSGDSTCSCSAPQQIHVEFATTDLRRAEVVATQSAYTALFGSQIADVQIGVFDSASPYPGEPYYGVAGFLYDFVYVDPVLGQAPTASAMQGNCQWAGKNQGILRVFATLKIMRRASAADGKCFYLEWSYVEQGVSNTCNRVGWGAFSGWQVLANGAGNNPYIPANFTGKSLGSCCIEENAGYVGRYVSVAGVADYQGSAAMTVLGCA